MDRDSYLRDPCGTLSIPLWKAGKMALPASIRIVHCRDWHGEYAQYQRFFRVKHTLRDLSACESEYRVIDLQAQASELSQMINTSYAHEHIRVSEDDLRSMQKHPTYCRELWVYLEADGRMAASGIAEYDRDCGEGVLEWIQVLPEYRGRGYGRRIVTILLNKLREMGADFVTVSGNLDNITSPLALYRACGFAGEDVWYICRI